MSDDRQQPVPRPRGSDSVLPMGVYEQVARLIEAFPRQQVTATTADAYVRELHGIERELLDQAVTDLVRTSEWFPTIAAIRRRCAEDVLALPSEADALQDIDIYHHQLRIAADGDRWPGQPHPLVMQALRSMGGLAAYRASERPDIWRTGFTRAYRELRAEAIREAQTGDALGSPEVYPATR